MSRGGTPGDGPGPTGPSGRTDRRTLLKSGALVLLLGVQQIARGATVLEVRVWPAPEYSRVTLESDKPLSSLPSAK